MNRGGASHPIPGGGVDCGKYGTTHIYRLDPGQPRNARADFSSLLEATDQNFLCLSRSSSRLMMACPHFSPCKPSSRPLPSDPAHSPGKLSHIGPRKTGKAVARPVVFRLFGPGPNGNRRAGFLLHSMLLCDQLEQSPLTEQSSDRVRGCKKPSLKQMHTKAALDHCTIASANFPKCYYYTSIHHTGNNRDTHWSLGGRPFG